MPITLSQLAERLGAEVDGAPSDLMITGVSSIWGARAGCLVFAEEEASLAAALASRAAAVLVGPLMTAKDADKPVLRAPPPPPRLSPVVPCPGPPPGPPRPSPGQPPLHPGCRLATTCRLAPMPRL